MADADGMSDKIKNALGRIRGITTELIDGYVADDLEDHEAVVMMELAKAIHLVDSAGLLPAPDGTTLEAVSQAELCRLLAEWHRLPNAMTLALLGLQEQHSLTDLEMTKVLSDHQNTLLSSMLKAQHHRRARATRKETADGEPPA